LAIGIHASQDLLYFNLGISHLTNRGITISLEDFNLNQKAIDESDKIIQKAKDKADEIVELYNKGDFEQIPGKTMEESREIRILQTLNEVRTKIGEMVRQEFPKDNPVNQMIVSGGRGNILNITQIACCFGQNVLSGKRIDIGYKERTLSFFKKGDLSPKSKGFIENSFIRGFRPDEFFFGAMTGRDSLMDTALRTPKSGYLYRRLANAIQDLKKEYDGTIRDSNNNIVQFIYGGDDIDVSRIHTGGSMDPGEAIGIITAQSFGESSTQMVLNTFHMAGVQEMQVTAGLPRIIEIFDARKKPSSPQMNIYLSKNYDNEKDARTFAEKIKEITVSDVASEIGINFNDKSVEIKIDKQGLRQSHMSIKKITDKINDLGFKAREKDNSIIIKTAETNFKEIYKLKEKIKGTIISGTKGVSQVMILKRDRNFVIFTLGTNLKDIINLKEVDRDKTISNDFHEIVSVFGIEAARQLIIDEIAKVLKTQGLDIDMRHSELMADAMTRTGIVKGVTRMGIIAQKSSILARATFETPDKQFVNASIKGSKDVLSGVIENIILNQPVPVGTGLPGLLVKITGPLIKKESEKKVAEAKVVEKTKG